MCAGRSAYVRTIVDMIEKHCVLYDVAEPAAKANVFQTKRAHATQHSQTETIHIKLMRCHQQNATSPLNTQQKTSPMIKHVRRTTVRAGT